MSANTQDLPEWIEEAIFNELLNKHTQLELCEVDSLLTPGKKLQYFVKPPDGTAYAASMRYITNSTANTNDVVKMQETMFSFCFVVAEPELQKELADETLKTRHVFAIGKSIGDAFPMPEATVKKSFRKPA